MARLLLLSSLTLLASGCDCSGSGGTCVTASECGAGEVCRDGRCEAALDAGGLDAGPGRSDAGPRVDGGEALRDGGGGPGDDGGAQDVDASCGGGDVPIVLSPPNVLVMIDRSCSMRRTIEAGAPFGTGPEDPMTRWNVAREAVRRLTERYPTRVRWGLMAFPDAREGCGEVPMAEVPPAAGRAAEVYAALLTDDVQPFHWCDMGAIQPHQTPTDAALEASLVLPELNDASRDRFVILLTDGAASCGSDAGSMTDVGMRLLAAGIPVAAIGFGADTTSGPAADMLEALALAGGLANPAGPPSYYLANDGASLDSVLDAIVFPSIPCALELTTVPPDPDELHVLANDVELVRDDPNGWSYDASSNTITLLGGACDDLRRGVITRLSVVYGCVTPMCVPRDEVCNGLDDDCDDVVDEACLG